jgi:hypothetical protein
MELRRAALIVAAMAILPVLQLSRASAWWSRAPADFEECADQAAKAANKQEKTAALAVCNSKFAGRRKPGGGYTYYDFLQDRSFDIAGPNPTPDEQRYIDQQYALYLERQRRSSIAEAYDARQQQQLQQAALQTEAERVTIPQPRTEAERVPIPQPRTEAERVPIPQPRPSKLIARQAAASISRTRERNCPQPSFSCLSETIHDLKKLFGVAQDNKDGKS